MLDAPSPVRLYVLDTSVLLSDPSAFTRFDEHQVVIPFVVLSELARKRSDLEIGWQARRALRLLDELSEKSGKALHETHTANAEGGTVRIELNHHDKPRDVKLVDSKADQRILTVALNLKDDPEMNGEVFLVTNDIPMRLEANTLGLSVQRYRHYAAETEWAGLQTVGADGDIIDDLFAGGIIGVDDIELSPKAESLVDNSCVVLKNGSQSGLARVVGGKLVQVKETALFDLRPKSLEQKFAMELLADDSITCVSMGGRAGTGKTLLALAGGLEAVMERKSCERIIVVRSMHAVGQQELGFLPGDVDEKMGPWATVIEDALHALAPGEGGKNVRDHINDLGLIDVQPVTHMRGRSLRNTWVIVDEAQNLERSVLLTLLSRIGEGSRVILTHDIAQRDNLHVGRMDGIMSVVSALRGSPMFAHIMMRESHRSQFAQLVTDVLDETVLD